MPYIKAIQVDDLELPSSANRPEGDAPYIVTLRRKAPFGADLAMQEALIKITPADMDQMAASAKNSNGEQVPTLPKNLSKIEVAASMKAMILAFIVNWTLTDENNEPLPITPESIAALDPDDGRFLQAEAKKRIAARRSEEARRPFGKPSGSPSAPNPVRASRRHGS